MTDYKPKNLDEVLSDLIGSALNAKASSFHNRDGEPEGDEYIHDKDFDDVIDQAIKDIKASENIKIEFKGDK